MHRNNLNTDIAPVALPSYLCESVTLYQRNISTHSVRTAVPLCVLSSPKSELPEPGTHKHRTKKGSQRSAGINGNCVV